MQTVLETKAFIRTATDAGMSDDERMAVVDLIARDPMAGEEIKGTGGCRKIRIAGKGKGKRGAYRVITFYSGEWMPAVLLAAYAKNVQTDLSPKEKAILKTITKTIVDEFKAKVRPIRSTK